MAERLTLDGKPLGKLELPGMGSVWGRGWALMTPGVRVYSDFVRPTSIYRLDMKTGQSSASTVRRREWRATSARVHEPPGLL